MSRISKKPIYLNDGVNVKIKDNNIIIVTYGKNELVKQIHNSVLVNILKDKIMISSIDNLKKTNMYSGTARSLINNMILGVVKPFEKTLLLVGVGYKVIKNDKILQLYLGFSHVITYNIPENVHISVPSATEIVLKSSNKELLGQAAANIRNYRVPESYKGKGIRYSDEKIILKEAKKK